MSRFIVDASVGAKWLLEEIHSDAARRLLIGGHELLVPDLVYTEIANALWQRTRRGEMVEQEALTALQALAATSWTVFSAWPLVVPALEIACRVGLAVYDSVYLALAVQEQAVMITADQKLHKAVQGSALSPYLIWVADAP